MQASAEITRLLQIMAELRNPETGCPWDKAQNFQSIAPYTIEEAYEVSDAVNRGDKRALCEELGDLLLQVVYHARLAEEEGSFNFADVARAINAKLMRRHPHIFDAARKQENLSAAAAKIQWEKIKAEEKRAHGREPAHYLDSILTNLPAALQAAKLQEKAENVGFDWAESLPVLEKLREEIDELQEALEKGAPQSQIAEYGDCLFTLINLGRKIGAEFEYSLCLTNQKFRRRFNYIEDRFRQQRKSLDKANLAAMEALWQEAKKYETDAGALSAETAAEQS